MTDRRTGERRERATQPAGRSSAVRPRRSTADGTSAVGRAGASTRGPQDREHGPSRKPAAPSRKPATSRQAAPSRQTTAPRPPAPRPTRRPAATPRRPARKLPRRPARLLRLGNPKRRLSIAFLAICVLLSVFAGRLVQLQGIDASTYAADAAAEALAEVTLPAARGDILDTNGVALAASVDAYDVVADQVLLGKMTTVAAAARTLSEITGLSTDALAAELSGTKRYDVVAKEITPAQARAVREAGIKGITTEKRSKRVYPSDGVAGNIVGFAGRDGNGLFGIEQGFDGALAGTPGQMSYWRALGGAAMPLASNQEVAPVAGSSVQLTIDREIQWYAERAITAKVAEAAADSGCVTVMRKTGEILALACTPTVDPNDPARTPQGQRGNKGVEEMYEPGSVFKVLTAAALVDSGTVTPDTPFTVPGSLQRGGHVINDHTAHGTLGLTFAGVIAESSNIGTILAAERLDKAVLRDYVSMFGIGKRLNLGLPGETAGLLPTDWEDLTRDTIAFGQGVSANIVQMASAYATIANGGVRVPPRLVSEIVAPDGTSTVPDLGEPQRVVSEDTAKTVTYLMEGAMGKGGTGAKISIPGYRLAGKTGTAQKAGPNGYSGFTASFMGFAPADDPELVVTVSIQEPQHGRYGGTLGGPVFADVMSFALQTLAVPPTGVPAPRVRLTTG